MALPIIPQDKANHYVYGSLIGIVAGIVAMQAGFPVIPFVMVVGALFGIFKEVLDYNSNRKAIAAGLEPTHGVEVMDAVYTILGGASSVVLIFLWG